MANPLVARIRKAVNAFLGRDPTDEYRREDGRASYINASRRKFSVQNTRSIINAVITRIGIDVASVRITHSRVNENEQFAERIKSSIGDCLSVSANIDQTGRQLIQDAIMSMCEEGSVAIVPIDIIENISTGLVTDITSLRVGKIVEWYPRRVKVNVYNDRTGLHEDLKFNKEDIVILENPLLSIMNEPNSTLQRLITKLEILDSIDKQSGNGKIDIIVQTPYSTRSDEQRQRALERMAEIDEQLKDSRYGVAYIDGTEKVVQLNRPVENNLMAQIEFLTAMLYGQLGLSVAVFDGTATEEVMMNYFNRTIEPMLGALTDGLNKAFLTKTARSQGQRFIGFRNPFSLIPISKLAEFADSFSRNEILSGNELRGGIGFMPSDDPEAERLRNKNLNPSTPAIPSAKEKNDQTSNQPAAGV